MQEIGRHILKVAEAISDEEIEKIVTVLINARSMGRKIMVAGAGRSGLVAKAFAMRLMHLGFYVYVLGETITPPVAPGDVFIAVSGSGMTQVVLSVARAAKQVGAIIVAITSFPDSPLGKIADVIIRVPGRTKIARESDYFTRQVLGIYEPLAPLGTLFEDASLAFFDGLIVELMNKLNIGEEDMRKRHANIETI